ncbi:ESPL1 isoform 5 [Pan troglodytes]|uniref:separase n=1 Tax=Pan troglodytes TaxID=9598 RepID=A0A2J8KD56_PANTR|nr:ESPL1 isoform 5 [Pan troglodytes]
MRSFKRVNFGTLLSSQKEAEELLPDLKEFLSNPPAGFPSSRSDAERRQACDAILRACNQQLTAKLACPRHLGSLLELAELACDGYLVSTPQRPPLYLERILFVLLRNAAAQGSPEATLRLAQPLHACLVQCSREAAPQDYEAVARGSFSLLWKGAEALLERRAAFAARLKALSFLVLLEDESTPCEVPHFASPTACRAVAAHQLFDASGHGLNEADADFLDDLLSRHVIRALVGERGSSSGLLSPQRALCLLELTLEHCRRFCWSRHHDKAISAVEKAHSYLRNTNLAPSLQLCQLGVKLLQVGEEGPQAVAKLLIKASAVLSKSMEAPSPPLRALYESCQFFLSGLERGTKRRYRLDAILSLFAFLGGYCSLLQQLRDDGVYGGSPKQQQSFLQMYFQGLHLYTVVVYDFAQGCQIVDLADLTQLVDSCKSTVVWMLEALEGLSGQELTDHMGMTASYTSNLAYSFYSHKLYAEACAISEPLCQHLGLVKPGTYPEVPPEKLHRCFRLQVESLKKLGKQAQGCKMVILWLAALQPCSPEHMAEPVTFWVRVKMDAARAGDKELQLKTLRDSLSGWDPETLALLLREELQAYKAVRADTGQERFNIICDLLELSPEETPAGAWARATHLVELAQVLCYHDFTQQTNCSALDAIREALQLLDSVRPEAQARDQLLDDKAQALLWLYICTLEAKMQEGIERDRRTQAPGNLEEFEVNDLNYEDKLQEDRFLYSNIAFNLAADAAQSKCLDQALALWKELLTKGQAPAVRCLQQTAASLQILAALYQLVAKPMQALEVLLLLRIVSERLKDHSKAAGSSCHITQLLLTLGCPSYAQLHLEEAASSLKHLDQTTDTYLLLSLTCDLLRSQLYWTHQKVTKGVSLLLSVLRDPALQKSSKAWYLLRVQVLQLVAAYLSLPSNNLSHSLWEQLCAQGWQTPEIALIDSHKLLRSIILLLMGSDILSTQKAAVETSFLDYGENLVQKWQVLSEVLSCSEKLVCHLGRLGSVSEAKAFCLEALKLTTKLQIPRQCALFLVLKGELELARNDIDLCQSDLQQVLFLLESCTESKPEVPQAPRVQQRVQTRLKVNFSDDSDLEDPVSAEAWLAEEPKRRGTASWGRGRARKGLSLKTDAVVAPGSAPGNPGLNGRSRRAKKVASRHCEERRPQRASDQARPGPEIMRTIPEEELTDNWRKMSFEILRGSDGEDSASGGKTPAPGPEAASGEWELLRLDSSKKELPSPCPDKESDKDLGPRLPSAPVATGLSTLDSICDSLSVAFRGISHCPPSGLYAHLCRFLALCLGHRDPYATAFLVTESVSITCRHQLLTHLHRQLSKAQKHRGSLEIADQLQGLSLQETPGDVPLARIQRLFSFRALESGHFPQPEKESFQERLALIPSGVTVCVLALATLQPGTVGNTLLLTRLEKDSPPVSVQIPTGQNKLHLRSVLNEFDAIQKAQKENSSCTDKREWWTGRLALDHRMEVLIASLEKSVLGCWKGLLLPSSEEPGPAQEASRLQELLQDCGWKYPDRTLLKIMLSGAGALTPQDIQALAYGLCPTQPERAQELLNEAVGRLQGLTVPSNSHLVLVLDKDLQKLPWESMPSLQALPVTRLPSFRFLLSYSIIKEYGASPVLSQGVDPRSTFYVLNPHNNLSSTEEQFRANFSSEAGWRGVVGEVPRPEQVQEALTKYDLYIYAGHGAGARFLDGQAVLRLSCRAVALLFGCSSAALAVHGNLEGAGIVLKYIMAGCPLFLGNLWDVTDRDIDRYTEALLQGWLGAGPGAPLLYYVNQARQAPRLKYLIGAAPIAYGLPVSLR